MHCVQKIILTIAVMSSICILAMDQSPVVRIIDTNEGESITSFLATEPGIVSVFGGTPRYSYYELYKKTLLECSRELLQQYDLAVSRAHTSKPPTRLKGVERRIRKLLSALRTRPGLADLRERLAHMSEIDFMRLFFEAGMETELLQKNIDALVKAAQEECNGSESCTLVHIFVPSYFSDLVHLRDDRAASEKLYCFLRNAARAFQEHFLRVTDARVRVCIVIPSLTYFVEAISCDSFEKVQANSAVVRNEIVQHMLRQSRCILLDHGIHKEGDAMATVLNDSGLVKVTAKGMCLLDLKGYTIHVFNPYLVIPKITSDGQQRKADYKTTPLFNQALVTFFQQSAGVSHE